MLFRIDIAYHELYKHPNEAMRLAGMASKFKAICAKVQTKHKFFPTAVMTEGRALFLHSEPDGQQCVTFTGFYNPVTSLDEWREGIRMLANELRSELMTTVAYLTFINTDTYYLIG